MEREGEPGEETTRALHHTPRVRLATLVPTGRPCSRTHREESISQLGQLATISHTDNCFSASDGRESTGNGYRDAHKEESEKSLVPEIKSNSFRYRECAFQI